MTPLVAAVSGDAMSIRTLALLMLAANVLGGAIPAWGAVAGFIHMAAGRLWALPVVLFLGVVALAPLLFYFVLYRNEQPLSFSHPMRLLAAATAVGIIASQADYLWNWVATLQPTSVVIRTSRAWTNADTSVLLGIPSAVVSAALLIAFARQRCPDPAERIDVDDFLFETARGNALLFGAVAALSIVHLFFTPIAWQWSRESAAAAGQIAPTFGHMFMVIVERMLGAVFAFVPPFMVWTRVRKRPGAAAEPSRSAASV